MSNFSTATEATATALNSAGSAARENARYMESIEARVTAVNAAFQKMSTAVVDSDLVKGILDIVKGLAEFGATDIGAAITQITLLSGVTWGGLQLLGQSILPGIISSFETFTQIVHGASLASIAADAGVTTLKAGMAASLPVILAVVAAIVTLIAIVKGVKKAYEEANPSVEQAAINMKAAQESLESLNESSEIAKQSLDELNATTFEDRTSEIQSEIDKLQALASYYETIKNHRKEEINEAVNQYTRAVEREGFKTGGYNASIMRSSEYDGTYLQELTNQYSSLEVAVIKAAEAEVKFTGTIIDVSNISSAQKELENLGWSFDETTISVTTAQSQMFGYLQQLQHGKELTPVMADKIGDLLTTTNQYASVLKNLDDTGVELNQNQQEFLFTYEALYNECVKLVEGSSSIADSNNNVIESTRAAADALISYAQELINAANAYQIFKDRLSESGDYDDAFKGFSSIFSEIVSEFNDGQIGSQKFLTGLELLTGQSFTSSEALEYMNNNLDTLQTLFGDAESGGTGLVGVLEDLGYALLNENGNLEINIDDFAGLADQLHISEGALYSLIEALRVMGIEIEYNVSDILDNIEGLGDGIATIEDGITHIDFEEFVKQAQKLGMTNDEIREYQNLLENASNTKLDNVDEGLNLLNTATEDGAEEVEGLESALNDLSNVDVFSVSSSISAIGDAASGAETAVKSLSDAISGISGIGFAAEGTSYAKEGPSLVNEEGPELIQSGATAYIAGGGYPTVTQLHEGDRVYTAEETKQILGNNKITGVIQAHSGESKTGITGLVGNVTGDVLSVLKKKKNKTETKSSLSSSKTNKSSGANTAQDIKSEFDEWLKAKKHALAMDEIAEEEYYRELEKMNDKYFKGKKEYQNEYWKYQEEIYSWEKKKEEEKAKAAEKAAEEAKKAYKNEFDSWLKEQDHALTMDEITQEEYYEALERMNDQYFKDKEEYQDEYWRYEEKIYSWRKRQAEEEAKNQEKILKEQIDLEKKLNDLAKAKASRVKVFQDGQFRYISDREALSKAQEALSGYANGTFSANGGLSIVGENGAEMRVLNKGDGILPSNITKNLWAWGSINPDSFKGNNGSDIYNFDIANLSLPDIKDTNDFVSGLKSYALQYTMQRGK